MGDSHFTCSACGCTLATGASAVECYFENRLSIYGGDFAKQASSKDAARFQQGSSKEDSSKNRLFCPFLTPIYGDI